MLKTVYFDLGNVLIFFSHSKMLSQVANCCGLGLEEVAGFITLHQEAYETGKIDSETVYRFFKAHSPKSFSMHTLMEAISDIFTPNYALWPIVEKIKQEGLRLVLLSNTSECHYTHISSHYPILDLFDHKILSFEVGAMKPNPLIFQKALSVSRCAPSECFYTDDIPAFVAGARKEGLDAELFTDTPSLCTDLIRRGCTFLEG